METLYPYPETFIAYLAEYFGSRDYFECHELMEELWKSEKGEPQEGCWLVLVRIAVAQYHARRGNAAGALKLFAKAARELDPSAMERIGLDGGRLASMMRERLSEWRGPGGVRYADFELPLADARLLQSAQALARERGWSWGTPGDRVAAEVIHRHLTRDRSEVVAARAAAAQERAEERAEDGRR